MQKKKWHISIPFWQAIVLAVIVRILAAIFIPQWTSLDNYMFIEPWMNGISLHGILNMYTTVTSAKWPVDYPPLYYTVMYYTVGWLSARITAKSVACCILRLFPLLLDIAAIYTIYRLFGKNLSLFWAVNFLIFYDSIVLGQSDSLLMFEFLLMYYAYTKKAGVPMGVIFAVMCLTKLQGCYFLPVYCYMLYDISSFANRKWKTVLHSVAAGAITGAAVWLPWSLHYGDLLYPVKFYSNAFSKNNALTQLAPNIGTIVYFLTGIKDAPAWYDIINKMLLLLFMFLFVFFCWKTKRVLFSASVYFFCIFMFTLNQHIRYPIYFLILLMLSDMLENTLPRGPVCFMACNEAAALVIRSLSEYALTLAGSSASQALYMFLGIDAIACAVFFVVSEWHIIRHELLLQSDGVAEISAH